MSMVSPFSTSSGSVKVEPSAPVPAPVPAASTGAGGAATKPKSKPRKRVNTAEKRHQHNAIERQRRETLNGKFLSLARLLPSLASHRRPSKSAIVNGSIAHLNHQRNQRLLAVSIIKKLSAERDELFREVNDWRKANGYAPKEGSASVWTEEMDEICAVENETFGNFATFDESAEDDENDDLPSSIVTGTQSQASAQFTGGVESVNLEQAAAIAGALGSHDLVTPRPSTDDSASTTAAARLFNSSNANAQTVKQATLNWAIAAAPDLSNFGTGSTSSLSLGFMSDSVDASSTSSPLGSHPNILTPLSVEMYTHTPSPRSSASEPTQPVTTAQTLKRNNTVPVAPATAPILPSTNSQAGQAPQQWSAEQVMAFQQQIQQQQLQRQQQQAALAAQHQAAVSFGSLPFNSMFLGGPAPAGFPATVSNSTGQPLHSTQNDALAQIMASMFSQQRDLTTVNTSSAAPVFQQQQALNVPDVNQWRKFAMAGLFSSAGVPTQAEAQPSLDDIKNAVRTGMGLGMSMSAWVGENQPVEGY